MHSVLLLVPLPHHQTGVPLNCTPRLYFRLGDTLAVSKSVHGLWVDTLSAFGVSHIVLIYGKLVMLQGDDV